MAVQPGMCNFFTSFHWFAAGIQGYRIHLNENGDADLNLTLWDIRNIQGKARKLNLETNRFDTSRFEMNSSREIVQKCLSLQI